MRVALNENFELRDTGCSDSRESTTQPRHRWYTLKEGFSPTIVKKALEESGCREKDLILDPFCGSGTVLLTSASLGFQAAGIEVNPFLAFVARTKLEKSHPHTLLRCSAEIRRMIMRGRHSLLEGFSTFSKEDGKEKWLFNKEVLRGFEGGWQATVGIHPPTKNILRLCLIGAAMDVCNANRDGKCLRYRQDWQELDFGKKEFDEAFGVRLQMVFDDLNAVPSVPGTAKVFKGDCRQLLTWGVHEGFKVCITSPPYLNSFDYSDIYRPEMFLGKFVKDNTQLTKIRLKTMRSHVQVKWDAPKRKDYGERFATSLAKIEERAPLLWDRRIPDMIKSYFEDWDKILRGLRRRAKKRASLWIVVSTSAYVGVEVPVDLILADIATRTGWSLREVGLIRHLRSSGQHWKRYSDCDLSPPKLRESVVILDANSTNGHV